MRGGNTIEERIDAGDMVGYIGDESILPDLAENLHIHPYVIRGAVSEALSRIGGPRALRVLTGEIDNRYFLQAWEYEELRRLGEAMGRLDGKEKKYYDLMRNRYEKGCKYSEGKPEPAMYFCMAWYGDDKCIDALINIMKTDMPEVQYMVADRLWEIGNKKAEEEMCMLVDYSKDQKLRKICTTSLGRRHAKVAVESLLDALGMGLALEASQALGAIKDMKADCITELKPLLLHKDDAVKLNAAFALARLGDKSGADAARAQLESKDKGTAAKAAAALVALGEEDGPAKLKAAWDKLDARERYWFIIDNLRLDPWALDFLKDRAASEPYPYIKRVAKDCVDELEKK
jgi:HEAT repeat protein